MPSTLFFKKSCVKIVILGLLGCLVLKKNVYIIYYKGLLYQDVIYY